MFSCVYLSILHTFSAVVPALYLFFVFFLHHGLSTHHMHLADRQSKGENNQSLQQLHQIGPIDFNVKVKYIKKVYRPIYIRYICYVHS